jgi:hemerythrin superfamily protein
MNTTNNRRTALFMAAGAVAAAVIPIESSFAQAMPMGGTWMTMIQTQHKMIEATFERLISSGNSTYLDQQRIQDVLSYQLTAHSVAEENVLYPMIASKGMVPESDKLYIDQAHAKVMNAQLEMALLHKKGDPAWLDVAKKLQAAVLMHAKQDEEANLYPRLQSMLSAQENVELSAMYEREFMAVKPRRNLFA